MQLEKVIETRILHFLRDVGVWARKIETVGIFDARKKTFRKKTGEFNAVGMPDIIGLLPSGRFLGIEVKSIKGRPTEHQLKCIRAIQDNGGVAFISRSVRQTYDQLLPFYPELEKFLYILQKYEQIERQN